MEKKFKTRFMKWLLAVGVTSAIAVSSPIGAQAQETVRDFKGEELVVQTLTGTAGKFFRDIAKPFEKKYNAKIVHFESLSSDTSPKCAQTLAVRNPTSGWSQRAGRQSLRRKAFWSR